MERVRRPLRGLASRAPGDPGSPSGRHYDRSAFNGWTRQGEGGESRWIKGVKSARHESRKYGPGGRKAGWSAGRRSVFARRRATNDVAPVGAPSPRLPGEETEPNLGRKPAARTFRHARTCCGHPRLLAVPRFKTWMAGTSPAMTRRRNRAARA